jgi:hypothetical protein
VVAAARARGCRVLAITEHAEKTISGWARRDARAARRIRAIASALGDSLL